jgi:hypothetical protein
VVAESALALVLLAGAGMLLNTFIVLPARCSASPAGHGRVYAAAEARWKQRARSQPEKKLFDAVRMKQVV